MKSLYLKEHRLSDIITAIQIMGSYKYAGRKSSDWAEYIGRLPQSASNWNIIFTEHPEFFLIKDGLAFLIWRRSNNAMIHLHNQNKITSEDYLKLDKPDKRTYSWPPLEHSQTEVLIHSAIRMHSCAIETNKDQRWAVPIYIAAFGFIGTLVAAFWKK
ncbi:MAG: hypothetical protein WA081_09835 [Desulfosalsimonadaceae bacterium]